MLYRLTSLCLLFAAGISSLSAQTWAISTGETSHTFQLDGEIDGQYPISMNLVKSDISGLGGYYAYISVGEPIEVQGHINGDSLRLYELDENFIPRAVFSGVWKGTKLLGTWTDLKKNRILPFELESTEAYRDNYSSTALIFERGNEQFSISMPEYPDPTLSSIVWEEEKGTFEFMVLAFEYYSLGTCRPRGMCGCGTEGWYFLIEYDRDSGVGYLKDKYQYTSCFKATDCDINLGIELRKGKAVEWSCYDSENESGIDYFFDPRQPQLGFQRQ